MIRYGHSFLLNIKNSGKHRTSDTIPILVFFFSSRRRHTRLVSDWSSDVCSSDLGGKRVASWADGRTETYAFTEIDRSLSGGVSLKGGTFGRPRDTLGIAFARNALSTEHRGYLAAGEIGRASCRERV